MLFLSAIETLSEDELRNYLAYVHAASFLTLIMVKSVLERLIF